MSCVFSLSLSHIIQSYATLELLLHELRDFCTIPLYECIDNFNYVNYVMGYVLAGIMRNDRDDLVLWYRG